MNVDERMIEYIHSLDRGYSPLISEIRKQALKDGVPIIRQETGTLLGVLLTMVKPKAILEVGTAVGFSALLMSEYAEDAHITTIENYDVRIPIAKHNFERTGKTKQITLLEGDAIEILKELDGKYDLIFVDAAKGQYIHFLEDVLRLLAPDGVLVSDNVLQDGDVAKSRYAIERRDRTIHKRMRDYLYTIKNHPLLETTILPVGDGVAISIKTGDNE